MRVAARLPLLLVFVVTGCPLGIETGYKVDEGSGGNAGATAGVGGSLPSGGSSSGGSMDGGAPSGGTDARQQRQWWRGNRRQRREM
jgi:hypothetical protein